MTYQVTTWEASPMVTPNCRDSSGSMGSQTRTELEAARADSGDGTRTGVAARAPAGVAGSVMGSAGQHAVQRGREAFGVLESDHPGTVDLAAAGAEENDAGRAEQP